MLSEYLGSVNLKHKIYMYVLNVITSDVVIDDNIDMR